MLDILIRSSAQELFHTGEKNIKKLSKQIFL